MIDDSLELAVERRWIYALLIVVTLGIVVGRIGAVRSPDGRTPFFSANDRSRWSTISSLVDDGTYAIDKVRQRPGWQSIDMVRHKDREGQLRYYSSKPPLFPTLLAGKYWLLKKTLGWSFEDRPFTTTRAMLILTNAVPFLGFLLLATYWAERQGETDFGRVFVVASACLGTFLTTFANTLNNHSPAAICVLVSTLGLVLIWESDEPHGWWFSVVGLSTGFAAANELPALSFLAAISLTLLWLAPRQTLIYYVPALLAVAVAFFAVTWWAHGSLRPPYAHRQPGDNWYDYPGSYWYGKRQGVDLGEPSRLKYLFHVLVGHHGFFSLTPVWLLSLAGCIAWLFRRDGLTRYLGLLTLSLFAICVVFYVFLRPQGDRNYGGVCSGFRWLFWLIPLWLMAMVPAVDWLSERRWGRILSLALLGISVLSATIPAANPWTHPWLFRWVGGP